MKGISLATPSAWLGYGLRIRKTPIPLRKGNQEILLFAFAFSFAGGLDHFVDGLGEVRGRGLLFLFLRWVSGSVGANEYKDSCDRKHGK